MAQKRPCDVSPASEQDKYSIALIRQSGEWMGLDVPLAQIFPTTTNAPQPIERVNFLSFHAGRGYDKFLESQYGYYDAYNCWTTTPGKVHPTLQQHWARGLRNADFKMPGANNVVWKKLVGAQHALAVSFVASANYNAERIVVLVRKQVPAGTTGAPSDLFVALKADSGGSPDIQLASATFDADNADTVSQYCVVSIAATALTGGTTYWVVITTVAQDTANATWEVACDPTAAGKKATLYAGPYTAATFSPYYRVTGSDPAVQYKPFLFDGALYLVGVFDNGSTASKLFLNGVRGRATGVQTATSLQDTSHGAYGATLWPTDRFANSYIRIIRGTGRGQVRQITSNSDDTFSVSPAWDITPVAGSSEYVVFSNDWFVEITGTGFTVVSGVPVVQNGVVYFPQTDGTVIRKMKIDYTDGDVHAWGGEAANVAYFLSTGYDATKNEPNIWRATQSPVGVSRASSAPAGVHITDLVTNLAFGAVILTGENTNLITGLQEHEGTLYVFKEDGMFMVQNDRAMRVKMGIEPTPDPDNGRASAVAGDKNLYVSFRNDVYLVSGGGAYSTGMKINLPAGRSGVVYDLAAAEGWLFAAVNGGTTGTSSVMKFSLDTKTWSEQVRAIKAGYRIRNVQWQPCPETRNRLWYECAGDMMYQQFPLNGVRPYDDKEIRYEHEGVLLLPTIDLHTTDPKYFAVLTVNSQGLATDADTEGGHVITVECQTDDGIGSNSWEHVDTLKTSPTASIEVGRGNARMIRLRLRMVSDEPTDPVIIETISLSLFTRNRLAHEWAMQFPLQPDDEEQNSIDMLMWLRDAAQRAEPLTMKSRFTLFHDRQVTLADEPRYQVTELDQVNSDLEAQIWIKLTEVI